MVLGLSRRSSLRTSRAISEKGSEVSTTTLMIRPHPFVAQLRCSAAKPASETQNAMRCVRGAGDIGQPQPVSVGKRTADMWFCVERPRSIRFPLCRATTLNSGKYDAHRDQSNE